MADFGDIFLTPEQINARREALEEYESIQKGLLETLGLISRAQDRVVESELRTKAAQQEINDLQKEFASITAENLRLERERLEAVAIGNQQEARAKQQLIDDNNTLIEQNKDLLELAEVNRRNAETLELVNKSAKNSTKSFITMTTGITDMVNSSDGFDQLLVRLADGEIGAEEMAEGFETALASITDMFSEVNLLANGMKFLYQAFLLNITAAISIDNAIVNFNKTLGSPGGFNDLLSDAADDLLRFGVSAADAVQNIGTLVSTVRDFADLGQDAQQEVAQFVSLLDKMGFSAEAQANNIVFLSKSFGLSTEAAAKFNTRLMSISESLDMPIQQVVQGFEEAKKVLGASAQTSEELAEQFGQLAAQADATNLSIGKLIGVAQKFDTFDSAAQQVGKLNAMLGGPFLSTVEMVGATNPAERIEMLADSLDRAGKSFDDMSYFERKAIADAAGLEDVNDLALLMSGNLSAITGPDLSEAKIVEMQEQMKEFNTIMDSFTNMMMSTVVSMAPAINVIKEQFAEIGEIIAPLQSMFKVIGYIASAVLPPSLKIVAGIVEGIMLPFQGIAYVIESIVGLIQDLVESLRAANVPIIEMGEYLPGILAVFKGLGVVLGGTLIPLMIKFVALQIRSAVLALRTAIGKIFQSFAALPFGVGLPLAFGAAAGVYALYDAVQADDLLSPGQNSDGYGDRMILGPEGAFALNNRDTVVAGTHLTQNTVNNNNTTTQAAAPAAAAPTGPINMNVVLSIDGSEIRTVVNSVKVDPTLNSNLYNSIAKLITSGDEAR